MHPLLHTDSTSTSAQCTQIPDQSRQSNASAGDGEGCPTGGVGRGRCLGSIDQGQWFCEYKGLVCFLECIVTASARKGIEVFPAFTGRAATLHLHTLHSGSARETDLDVLRRQKFAAYEGEERAGAGQGEDGR
jgi:hypothetical protein